MSRGISIVCSPVLISETTTPLEVNLSSFQNDLQASPLYVYLCIPELENGTTNLEGKFPRYLSSLSTRVSDINTGGHTTWEEVGKVKAAENNWPPSPVSRRATTQYYVPY